VSDKKQLLSVARHVRDALIAADIGTQLTICDQWRLQDGGSDGWYVNIGRMRRWNCTLQVWLDRYARYPRRKFYYGFFSNQKADIRRLERHARKAFGKPVAISREDVEKVSKGTWLLAKKLPQSDFGQPVIEIYQTNQPRWWNFYGVYVMDGTGLSRDKEGRLVERITEYVLTIVGCLPGMRKEDAVEKAYPRIENRRVVERHLKRERSGYLATLRKQSDDYICQVCGFDFTRVIGEEKGRHCVDAHHRRPLSLSSRVRRTLLDDLVTVCPNCHRMLHQMRGMPRDVEDLKKVVKKHNRR
jgi:5-methylcytosine-specific restriction endonuclease McrA